MKFRTGQHKRGWMDILQSRPVLLVLSIMVLIFAWSVFGFLGKMQTTRENRQMAESQLIELEKAKEKLSSDIAKLKTDEGVEESIRKKFGLAKEGEGVIIIVGDNQKQTTPAEESGGFWTFWADLFR